MSRSLKMLAILGLTALAVTACGVRGPLEVPKSQDNARSVQPKPEETPHRSNPLDRLLR
jgi:predicted small lipoprotein YifL